MKGHGDLRLLAWGSTLSAIVALVLPWPAISLLFVVPLALFAPGYAIVAAAFARHRRLNRPRLLVLSLALSLAVLALGGLFLNYLGGIHAGTWTILLLLVVAGCCRTAALRRDYPPEPLPLRLPKPGGAKLGLALAGLAVVVAAFVLASATLPAKSAVGYTELWIVPELESEGSEALVGVRSEEQQTTEYDLGVRIGKQLVKRSFVLTPGEGTTVRVGPPLAPASPTVPIVATLLLDSDPSYVYRRVESTLTAPASTVAVPEPAPAAPKSTQTARGAKR
jgi:Protein of unknown function (DUF1616)